MPPDICQPRNKQRRSRRSLHWCLPGKPETPNHVQRDRRCLAERNIFVHSHTELLSEDLQMHIQNEKYFIVGNPITLQDIKGVNIPTMQVQKLNIKKVSLDKLHELKIEKNPITIRPHQSKC
ncbi:hypothetical protein JTB14_008152 [Gonioctena quinquepunctata]|nr:hypothetical protein JTB14_008152 [Gonioctena quinquepunctata]